MLDHQCDLCGKVFVRDGYPNRIRMMDHRIKCLNHSRGLVQFLEPDQFMEPVVPAPTAAEIQRTAEDLQRLLKELS